MTELRSVTCHMGSDSVTCHPTQVSAPRLNPSHTGRYSIYLPRRDGRLSCGEWAAAAGEGGSTYMGWGWRREYFTAVFGAVSAPMAHLWNELLDVHLQLFKTID